MLGKFVSIVHGQRMDLTFDLTQRPYDYIGDVIGLLGEDGLHAGEASFSVHQSQQAPTTVPAHHQINFPITDSSCFIDDSGVVVNENPVGNRAFICRFGRNSLRLLVLVQVSMKSTSAVSIHIDMLVDLSCDIENGSFCSSQPAICAGLHS